MKLPILCVLVAIAKATEVYQSPYYVSTGKSHQFRNQDSSGNYQFGYDESHSSGGTTREEHGDAWGNKWGSYSLRDADGRYRKVNYIADAQGFRADIESNEPGVAPKDPASATITTTDEVRRFEQRPIEQRPIEQRPIEQRPIEQRPIEQKPFEQKPVIYAEPLSDNFERIDKPILYAPPVTSTVYHHSYNPEYPLLYQSPYGTTYTTYGNAYAPYANAYSPYASYGHYKGSPFRRYGTYYNTNRVAPVVSTVLSPYVVSTKGSPTVVTSKGSPAVISTKGSPAVISTKGSAAVISRKGSSTVVSRKGAPVPVVSTKGSPSTKGAPFISSSGYFYYP